jgi:Beta-glucosidase-related glycosidases
MVVNFEYMGEDPYLASKMVVPFVKGVQQNGVAATMKHFALNNQGTMARTYRCGSERQSVI